jgi:hypothetical protein
MATLYADTPGQYGQMLQARRQAQANAMNRAADQSARLAFDAQSTRQNQLNQRSNMFANTLQARQRQANAEANILRQAALNRQASEEAAMRSDRLARGRAQFQFDLAKPARERQAKMDEEVARKNLFDQNRFILDAAAKGIKIPFPADTPPEFMKQQDDLILDHRIRERLSNTAVSFDDFREVTDSDDYLKAYRNYLEDMYKKARKALVATPSPDPSPSPDDPTSLDVPSPRSAMESNVTRSANGVYNPRNFEGNLSPL